MTNRLRNEQWISFWLGGEKYAHQVASIKEILLYEEPNAVPGAPPAIEGILSVRGMPISIISGHKLLSVERGGGAENKRIIILEIQHGLFGVSVDEVGEILTVHHDQVERGDHSAEESPVIGTARNRDELLILVDFSVYCGKVMLHE